MRATRIFVLAVVVIVLLASAAVRFYRLDQPKGYIFDEIYYAKDAKSILDGRLGPKTDYQWMPGDEVSWPHPYYGKLAISLGILAFGDDEFGWRFIPALAGLALLCLVYPLARRLGLCREWALLALILAAADLLGIAQSRIATLDIFVALWSVATVYLALRYVQSGGRLLWLVLTGVAGGLAIGTKWSGAYAILAALILILVLWRRQPKGRALPSRETALGAGAVSPGDESPAGESGRRATSRRERVPVTARSRFLAVLLPLVFLVLLPAGLYVASYGFYFSAGHGLSDFWQLHREMWTFSTNLDATHTYASQAPTWILDIRPVWYYFKEIAGEYHGVVAMGHPLLWWSATLALVVLPVMAIVDRRRALLLPTLIVALLYFPWFATSRTSFLYYMAPVAPFLAILLAASLARLARRPQVLEGDVEVGVSVEGDGCSRAEDAAEPGWAEDEGRPFWDEEEDEPLGRRRRGSRSAGAGGLDGAANSVAYAAAVFLATAAVTALAWWQIGRLVAFVFYELPASIAPAVGIAVSTVVGASVLIALTYAAGRTGLRRVWRYAAWAFTGAVLGLTIAFAPIVLDLPIPPDEFYRLMWLPTWI